MRWSHALLALALVILAAACGSPAVTQTDGDGNGTGSEQSEPVEATEAAGDGGGADEGGGEGSGSGDVDRAFEILTPPNSTQITRTDSEGIIFAAFDSSDSLDVLRSFYESAIPEAGLQILSTTEAQDGIAWTIAESEGSTFGGAVSLFPSTDGSGTQVSITIGAGN